MPGGLRALDRGGRRAGFRATIDVADRRPTCGRRVVRSTHRPLDDVPVMTKPSVSLSNPYKAAFLAWLCPGLGHIYQGRIGKGILYAVCILSLYFVGFAMGEGKIVYWRWVSPLQNPEKFCLHYVGQFFVGLPALPALIQGTLSYFQLGTVLWDFMAEPPQNVINGLHPRLGKLVEVGTIYTTVAGLLNILAIYDAYEGPAYSDLEDEPVPAAPSTGTAANVGIEGLKAEAQA